MNTDHLTSPQTIVYFICSTFGFMSFCSGFFVLDPDTVLCMGIIRLLLGTIYFIGALINIFRGAAGGNLNLISAVCFGLFAGSNMAISSLYDFLGLDIQPLIYCIVQIFGASYILMLLPALDQNPFYNWIMQMMGALGLLAQAFQVILASQTFKYMGGIFFLIYGLCGIYGGLSSIVPAIKDGPTARAVLQKLSGKKNEAAKA